MKKSSLRLGLLWMPVALGLALPLPAAAFDAVICVATDGLTDGACGDRTCTREVVGTLADALDAAALVVVEGKATSVMVCGEGPGVFNELVAVDNSGGRLGRPLLVELTAPLCPAQNFAEGEPLVRWSNPWAGAAGEGDELRATIDLSPTGPCGGRSTAGVRVEGPGHLFVNRTLLRGTAGYALRGAGSPPPILQVSNSHLLDGTGPAVWADGSISLDRSQIEGFLVGPSTGGAAVVTVRPSADTWLSIAKSSVARNVVDSSDGVRRSVLRGRVSSLDRVFIGLNLLGDDSVAVHTGYADPVLHRDSSGTLTGHVTVQNSVLSRNVRTAESELGRPMPSPIRDFYPVSTRCAAFDPMFPWAEDSAPSAAAGGAGPLVFVDPEIESSPGHHFNVYRTAFVENETGASPVLAVRLAPSVSVSVIQNSFVAGGISRAAEFSGEGQEAVVSVLRNLFFSTSEPTAARDLLSVTGSPLGVVVSGNAATPGVEWTVWGSGAPLYSLIGRQAVAPAMAFEPMDPLATASPCVQFAALCPDGGADGCEAWSDTEPPCALDAAARWLLHPDWSSTFMEGWAWEKHWFQSERSGWGLPGVQGGRCRIEAPTYDSALFDGAEPIGDGDGAADAIDCANDDATVVPFVPELDGHTTPYCVEVMEDCYRCPNGSVPPPEPTPPEGTPGATPASGDGVADSASSAKGCAAADGCAYSWTCSGEGSAAARPAPTGGTLAAGHAAVAGIALALRRGRRRR